MSLCRLGLPIAFILFLILMTLLFSPIFSASASPTSPTGSMGGQEQVAEPSVDDDDWLGRVNELRAKANLPAVTENTVWSDGDWKHSRYMVKNDTITHSEDSSNEWYTEEGAEAATNSNVSIDANINASDVGHIDSWMEGPFHGIAIVDPKLTQMGYGSYREDIGQWKVGATLDVLRGRESVPDSVTFPVMWPADGQSTDLTTFHGNESPDPLSSCSGYEAPTGMPIYLQLGTGDVTPDVTNTSLQQGGQSLEHCVFDETTYTNDNSSLQSLGRSILNMRDAVVIIPRDVLVEGSSYTVSVTTNGETYTWTFSVDTASTDPTATPTQEATATPIQGPTATPDPDATYIFLPTVMR